MNYSKSTIIITVSVIIIILVLASLFSYFAIKVGTIPPTVQQAPRQKVVKPVAPAITPTNIVVFMPPETLPTVQKTGNCFASSIAQPYRKDAWRCTVKNAIYDPCFSVAQKGFVYCQVGIDASTGFLMKLTQALPKPEVPAAAQDNWAWFLTLKDGTQCSPFTGTRPFFGQGPNSEIAYYSCKSDNPDQQIMLLGDLAKNTVWTANEAILVKSGGVPTGPWVINSTKVADIDTVWQ